MQEEIADRLIGINREFYQSFAAVFSETRGRLQPGVRQILEGLSLKETILDLGCGNGELAADLDRRHFTGTYVGVDFSEELLGFAREKVGTQHFHFIEADLTKTGVGPGFLDLHQDLKANAVNRVFAFAVLHHIPTTTRRVGLLKQVHQLLSLNGRLEVSNWNFMSSDRIASRVVSWGEIGLRPEDVDHGDYLIDWRREGYGLRYVHLYSEMELTELASRGGFSVRRTFYSDGEGGKLGLYQTWEKGLES